MRANEWRKALEPMLGVDWAYAGTIAYRIPVEWNLFGLCADGPSRRPDFYLWAVQMPLYRPFNGLSLSWSERCGGGAKSYSIADPQFPSAIATAAQLAEARHSSDSQLLRPSDGVVNDQMLEAQGYAHLLDGEEKKADDILQRVALQTPTAAWHHESLRRAERIRKLIMAGSRPAAIDQLRAWRAACLDSLGIEAPRV